MSHKLKVDKGSNLRCLLLLFILSFSPFEISYTAAFQIIRPNNGGSGQDSYDRGRFVYNHQIVDVNCAGSGDKCQCNAGGTFVFTASLQPTCIGNFYDVFGCYFHLGSSNKIKADDLPYFFNELIGDVYYYYEELDWISIKGVSYWNMTWYPVPEKIFRRSVNMLRWKEHGDSLSKYGGLLLRINLTASLENDHSTTGCLLLKIAGTRTYPLTPYISQVISVSSERSTLGSVTSSASSVVTSLSTFDTSMSSVLSASYRSQPHSINIKSIASTSQTVIYPSWSAQRSNAQATEYTPIYSQGVDLQSTRGSLSISSITLSSSIQTGSEMDTSKQSSDDVPVIVGSLLGSLFGVAAIVMVTLLCRRKFFGMERSTMQDVLQLQKSARRYDRNGSVSEKAPQRIENPTYGEAIDLTLDSSAEKKPSVNLYESPCNGIIHKNQAPDQVYSEIDERQEPVYNEVDNDEPIYKEVIEGRPISQGQHVPSDPSNPQYSVYQVIAP